MTTCKAGDYVKINIVSFSYPAGVFNAFNNKLGEIYKAETDRCLVHVFDEQGRVDCGRWFLSKDLERIK